MPNAQTRLEEMDAVLVADVYDRSIHSTHSDDRMLEGPEVEYADEVASALRAVFRTLHVLQGPSELTKLEGEARKALVFTIFGGAVSRNRMALVPAVCEVEGFCYVGADAWARIICQDKYLAKVLVQDAGFLVPSHTLIRGNESISLCSQITLPCVVKPNLEGSSIGISDHSLVETEKECVAVCRELIAKFKQPVLVEEFVPGREVSLCLAGTNQDEILIEAAEVHMTTRPNYFDNHLFSAEEKERRSPDRIIRRVTDEIHLTDLESAKRIFDALGKVDYLRIDGKLHEGRLHILELTPDAHLGRKTHFAEAFRQAGIGYVELIQFLSHCGLSSSVAPSSND